MENKDERDQKQKREEDESPGFKVLDRRRFDSSGNERGAGTEGASRAVRPESVSKTSTQQPKPEKPSVKPNEETRMDKNQGAKGPSAAAAGESDGSEFQGQGNMTFSSFIISLATQALMQLGEMRPPDGVEVAVDRAGAQQTIEIISMLNAKTKGNLSADEARLMEEILHNLRLSFVRPR